MNLPRHGFSALACLLLAPCLALNVTGCLADGEGMSTDDTVKAIDPFPRPQGPKIIPLDQPSNSEFRYVELDTAGRIVQRIPTLLLHIGFRRSDIYTYAFEDPKQGFLVRYQAAANGDSTGVYILGTFKDSVESLYPVPVLWVPQNPKMGASWPVGAGRTMELVDSAEQYFTETLFKEDTVGAPVSQGFQRHTAYLFRETAQGDTVTYYHFRKGVGCLGFERSAGDRLIASGTIKSFYKLTGRPF